MIRAAAAFGLVFLLLLAAGCSGFKDRRAGDRLAKEGDWDHAIILYQSALEKNPDSARLKKRLDHAKREAARVHFSRAEAFMKEKKAEAAVESLKRAIALDPRNEGYRGLFRQAINRSLAARHLETGRKMMEAERPGEALQEFAKALALDPNLSQAQAGLEDARARAQISSSEMEGLRVSSNEPITLKFDGAPVKDVFGVLSRVSGINILFDQDLRPRDTVTIFVKEASFQKTLGLILNTNNLFMKKISADTILIIPRTPQKLQQYEDLLIRTFYLSHADAKEMQNLLRTMLDAKKMIINENLNAILVRDTPEKVRLAEKIIEANDRKIAEVSLELEVLEVNRTTSLKYGWNLNPGQATVSPGVEGFSGGALPFSELRNLTAFFSLPSAVVDLLKTDSDAQVLANPNIRVVNNEEAKINIGDRVPILLSTTTTSAASTGSAPTSSTATSIEFKDVGIKLDVKPRIHLNNDVTLKLNVEVSSLGELVDLGNQKQFKFGTRTAETTLHVGNGETVVIGGLIRDEDRITANKIPILGDLPILGRFFSNTEKGKIKTDVILTITPRVVGELETPHEEFQSFWSGTGDHYSTTPVFPK